MCAYKQTVWDLSDLFPAKDSPELEQAFKTLDKKVTAVEKMRELLKDDISSADFLKITKALEEVYNLVSRLYGYAELSFAENTQDQAAQSLVARVGQFASELENRTLFFSLWWKALDDTNANRLLENAGNLQYYFEAMRAFKKHTLSEPEEKIINTKNVTGMMALNMLYNSITNRYVYKLKVGRKVLELNREELMQYARSSDPALRAAAYQELYRVYGHEGPILGQIYQTIVRDWRNENVQMRNYASPLAARNLVNDIPDEVVDTLLYVCQKNTSVFQRYFKLKAKLLKLNKLRRYDIYAPISKSSKKYPFQKGVDLVFQAYKDFDPEIAAHAKRVFDDKHMDSEVRKGKMGGAFCSTLTPNLTPYVLMSYLERGEDVATLAHELGHAVHSLLAEKQTIYTQTACLPLSETASTFGEMLVTDKLLKGEKNEAVKRDIIFKQLDDAYATIQRQAYFALYEKKAHQMIEAGASPDELAAEYYKNLEDQFGDAVDVADEFRWEWVSIPHIFHTPFYVYAYAFGQLLVLSLYQQYKVEGESFKPRYKALLAAGGSVAPVKILSETGVNIYSPDFWQGGFDVIEGLINQVE